MVIQIDMPRLLFTLFCLLLVFQTQAQPLRYKDQIFKEIDTLQNIEYTKADFLNNPIDLLADYNVHEGELLTETRPIHMDIFMPRGDSVKSRPLLLFAHSGAFLIGSRKNDDMLAMCDSFAHRGYVTATMDYRKGMGAITTRLFGLLIGLKVTKESGYRAIYRATQDSKAAIRFLKHNAEIYGIDTTKIYLVGSSAGGIMSLYSLYLDKEEEIPVAALFEPSLGGLDNVGTQGYGSKANAVASFWGAMEDLTIIEEEKASVFLVHGEADEMVPFKKGIPLVNMIEPNPMYSLDLPETFGSFCIDTMLNKLKVNHEKYFVKEKEHEFYGVNTGMFPEEGPNVYWDTIQNKLNTFFYDLVKPNADFDVIGDGLDLSFSAVSEGIISAKWDFGDGFTGEGTSILHTYQAAGNYNVRLTVFNKNGALETLSKIIITGPVSHVESAASANIRVYPNPAKTEIFVEGISKIESISVLDLHGKKLISRSELNNKSIKIDMLEDGIYVLSITSSGKTNFYKFLKNNY